MGDGFALVFVLGGSVALFLAINARYRRASPTMRLPRQAADPTLSPAAANTTFRVMNASTALRLKERKLLLRDPWLISQSLMQLLYLIPPAVLLWNNLGRRSAASIVLVPVLIMTAGQLAGGLAWLTIRVKTHPISSRRRRFRPRVSCAQRSKWSCNA